MPIKFEYRYIESSEDRHYIKAMTNEIRAILPKMQGSRVPGEDFFTIGSILLEMRTRITPKALFYAWIETELYMSKGIAAKYMKIVRVFGEKYDAIKHVPYTTLHELTYPSYPPSILQNIESGGYVPSRERIREIRDEHAKSGLAKILDAYAQINTQETTEHQSTQRDIAQELDAVREDFKALSEKFTEDVKHLSEKCRKAEQERDMLIASLKKLVEHENSNIVRR